MPPNSPLKSLIRQSPPQPIVFTSVPLLTMGGAPGMNISTVASQVPASIASTLCSGPGVGGCWAAADPESAKPAPDPETASPTATAASDSRPRIWTFIVTSCGFGLFFLPTRTAARVNPDESHASPELVKDFLEFACWDNDVHGKADHRLADRAA